MLNALDSQRGLADGAKERNSVNTAFFPLQDDALARGCEAALTSIVFGLAIGVQAEVGLVLSGQINSQRELPHSDFFKAVSGLLGQGGLKFTDFLIRLAKLSNEVRLGALSVDDGLLRFDYLIVELGAQLSELRPVAGINCPLGERHESNN